MTSNGVMRARTQIVGKCMVFRVDDSPRAYVEPISKNPRSLVVSLGDKVLSSDRESLLGQQVIVSGVATYDLDTMTIIRFQAESITPYSPASPREMFQALATSSGDRWDGVDANEFVKELRDDD